MSQAPPSGLPAPVPSAQSEHRPAAQAPLILLVNDPELRERELPQVFSAKLGRPYEIYNLAHRARGSVIDSLSERSPVTVVALGAAAHDLARSVPGVEVLHAGVLRPDPAFRGVDALPPFTVQLDYWLRLVPGLKRIGVIGSPGMKERMNELAAAAAEQGLTLERRTVHSDTESALAFRAMVPHIDGFAFLPDETVLSPRVIRQILSHGRQNGVQMLVYSPLMYSLGGSLLVQPDPVGVAGALIDMLKDPGAAPEVTQMRTQFRPDVDQELSASVSIGGAGR